MKKIISVLIILLIIIGGVYYSTTREINPEKRLRAAEENMRNADSYNMEIIMEGEFDQEEELEVGFEGDYDIDFANKALEGDGEVLFQGQGISAKLGASSVYVEDNLYGKVTSLPAVIPLEPKQWDLLTEETILLWEGVLEDVNEFLSRASEEDLTAKDLWEKSWELNEEMWEEGVWEVREVEEDEVRGERAEKFTVKMDGEKLGDIYIGLIDDYNLLDLLPEEADKEELREELVEEFEGMDDEVIEMWVNGEHIVKMKMQMEVELEDELEEEELEELTGQMPENMAFTSKYYYDNFNEEFEIEAPEEYIRLEEVLEGFGVSKEALDF